MGLPFLLGKQFIAYAWHVSKHTGKLLFLLKLPVSKLLKPPPTALNEKGYYSRMVYYMDSICCWRSLWFSIISNIVSTGRKKYWIAWPLQFATCTVLTKFRTELQLFDWIIIIKQLRLHILILFTTFPTKLWIMHKMFSCVYSVHISSPSFCEYFPMEEGIGNWIADQLIEGDDERLLGNKWGASTEIVMQSHLFLK